MPAGGGEGGRDGGSLIANRPGGGVTGGVDDGELRRFLAVVDGDDGGVDGTGGRCTRATMACQTAEMMSAASGTCTMGETMYRDKARA